MATPVRALGDRQADGRLLLHDHGLDYRDGAESRLLDIISAATDISSNSDELTRLATDWPTRYHLDSARVNVLRALDLDGATALEIGAGCGTISRYLGEHCALVDALEPVPERAVVARARTRDQANVEVLVGQLADVPDVAAYDVILVIGVLEYVGGGASADAPYLEFLRGVASRLHEGGTLILAIENKLGVKYLVGAPEDHTNRPFDSLESYPNGGPARTFSRRELAALLAAAGFRSDFKAAFPDYKMTRAILGDFPETTRTLLHRVPRFPSPDWQAQRPRLTDEYSLWRSLVEAGAEQDFGNSFVVLASKGEAASRWPDGVAGAFFSVDRRSAYAASTFIDVSEDSVTFRRVGRIDGADPTRELSLAPGVASYCEGFDLTEVLTDPDADAPELLGQWLDLLDAAIANGHGTPIDLVPHNVVIDDAGKAHSIDVELMSSTMSREQVIQRGIIWLADRVAMRTTPQRWPDARTVRDIAVHFGAMVGLDDNGDWVERSITAEARIQAEVGVGPPPDTDPDAWLAGREKDLRQRLDTPLADLPLGSRAPELAAAAIASLRASIEALEAAKRAAEHQRDAIAKELADVVSSRGMRLIRSARRAADIALPAGSRRRALGSRVARLSGIRRRQPSE